MTVTIRWVEQNIYDVVETKIATFSGMLKLYKSGNIITSTEWCFENSESPVAANSLDAEIQAYLNNEIATLPVYLKNQGSYFRQKVWREICKVPAGQVITYSALAKKIDSGARAVANACRDNPFPGIIPCHRVVAKNGYGGYMGQTSGCFLEIKKKLLAMENAGNVTN